jgi:predicted negative regulator of RcsB-dependent stress response
VNDLSEKEQLEAMRAWWADNGNYVIAGVIVGIVTIFGWNRWQSTIANAEIEASTLYEEVMAATGRSNLDSALIAADRLYDEYGDTAYAAQARLAMARLYMDTGRDQDAADTLRELIDSNPEREIALVARLRLAKILLYQDKAQEVADLVAGQSDTAFAARFNDVLGDAHVALGNYAEALAAYTAAISDNPAAPTVDPNLVQLKINDLPLLNEVDAQEAPGAGSEPTEEPATTIAEPEESAESAEPEESAAADSAVEPVDAEAEGESTESDEDGESN